ncbi:MAG: prolipoprotein diacylglyceryl transferase family protein [Leptospirales bacterium]
MAAIHGMIIQFPINIEIGYIHIPSHLLFEVIAFYVAIRWYLHLKKDGASVFSDDERKLLLIGAAAGALFGSRVLGFLEHPGIMKTPLLINILTVKTIVGGLLGAIIGVEVVKKFFLKTKTSSGDLFVFPVILGMGIGRIGCFLTGVTDSTAGLPSSLPWALQQGDAIARHPTSLYDIIFLSILGVLLYAYQNKTKLQPGVIFRLFIIAYMGYRFLIEFIKPVDSLFMGLSAIQLAAVGGFISYVYSLSKNGLKIAGGKLEES